VDDHVATTSRRQKMLTSKSGYRKRELKGRKTSFGVPFSVKSWILRSEVVYKLNHGARLSVLEGGCQGRGSRKDEAWNVIAYMCGLNRRSGFLPVLFRVLRIQ